MRFSVEAPGNDPEAEHGPPHVCWQGDELCAWYPGGPCTAVDCTCETTGDCQSCRPRSI